MSFGRYLKFIACLFVLALAAGHVLAQGFQGSIRGEITDPSGAVVPGARVTLTDQGTGETRTQTTTSAGTFEFPNLLTHSYQVKVEATGFKTFVQNNVKVDANRVHDVLVKMEIGQVAEVVEVSAGAEVVQTTTSQLAGTFDSQVVTQVPLPISITAGESPLYNLAILQPGTTSQPGGVEGEGGAIGGNRPRDNNFVIDGIDNNRVDVTGSSLPVITDAVSEFTLITNQFSAEYGHSTAGQFIVSTKSGTNEVHGNLFYFVNNRNFNAADNLTKAAIARGDLRDKPRFDRNQVGGTLGGPIIKDHFFLFGAYQYTTLGQAATPGAATEVPTAAGYATLSQLAGSPGTGISSVMLDILRNNITPAASRSRTLNIIRADTGATVPVEVGVLTPSAPNFFNEHDFHINGDVVTARHRHSVRTLYNRIRQPDVPSFFPLSQFIGDVATDGRSITYSDAFTISPTLINEFRVGYRRFIQALTLPTDLRRPSTLDVFPNFTIDELNLTFGPTEESPQSTAINTYQAVDQITKIVGGHNIKTGVDFRWWIAPSDFLPRSRGEYTYTDLTSYIGDLIPNGSNGGLRGVGTGVFAGNQKAIYTFFQDDWKARPRLTLNLGLRYEYSTNPRDANLQALNSIASVPGVIEFLQPRTDRNNFGPRIGLAWDPLGDGKTSIRAGFGIAYDVIFQNLTLLQLPPQFQQELDIDTACAFPTPPPYCATRSGFIAAGGLPFVPLPPTTPEAARTATQSLIVDTVAPETYTWSLSMQREFFRDFLVELRYVGTRGLHLPAQIRLNAGIPPSFNLPTFFRPGDVPSSIALTAPSLADFQAAIMRRLASFGFQSNLTAFEPEGNSIYHGASIQVERRFSRGLYLNSAYTFSRTLDDSTNELFTSFVNPRRPQDPFNVRDEWGLSALDRTHKFTTGFIYETPKIEGAGRFANAFVNGWQINVNYIAETGQPVTPLSFIDANGNRDTAGDRTIVNPFAAQDARTGTDVSFICRGAGGATSIAPSAVACGGAANVVGYLANNPSAKYVQAQVGAKATAGRNTERAAGLNNWNLGFFKNTYFSESTYLQFRVELLNAFNHPQHTLGAGTVFRFFSNARENGQALVDPTNPSFLRPEEIFGGYAGSGFNRFLQLGLKLFF
jgi:outer membrane receptor protein involved in Fe transport